jgi:hypothetical protein
MDLTSLVIQLIGGVASAQGITTIFKKLSSGSTLDTITGLIGGFAGGQVAGLIPGMEGTDIVAVLGNLVGGGLGGGVLTAIVGLVRQALKR